MKMAAGSINIEPSSSRSPIQLPKGSILQLAPQLSLHISNKWLACPMPTQCVSKNHSHPHWYQYFTGLTPVTVGWPHLMFPWVSRFEIIWCVLWIMWTLQCVWSYSVLELWKLCNIPIRVEMQECTEIVLLSLLKYPPWSTVPVIHGTIVRFHKL